MASGTVTLRLEESIRAATLNRYVVGDSTLRFDAFIDIPTNGEVSFDYPYVYFLRFSEIAQNLRRKAIQYIRFFVYARYTGVLDYEYPYAFGTAFSFMPLPDPYDDVIQYIQEDVAPPKTIVRSSDYVYLTSHSLQWNECYLSVSKINVETIKNGIAIGRYSIPEFSAYLSPYSSYAPYISIDYDDIYLRTRNVFPESGWIDEHVDNTFTWEAGTDDVAFVMPKQASAVFRWRVGEGGAVTEIPLGTETQLTIPAGTFPEADNIQWQVIITSDDGITADASAPWYTITTIDAVPVVVAQGPSNTFANGKETIRLSWGYATATGSPQKRYEISYKTPAMTDWTQLTEAETPDTFADIPAGALPSGTVTWRVRAYNSDDAASEWSEPLTFVVIDAPKAPAIRVTAATPRPAITWQTNEQQAFQVQMGSHDSGIVFGLTTAYKSPVYLPDGATPLRVRIQNEFGLWSDWSEYTITIANEQTELLPLTATATPHDALLTWVPTENAMQYLVYRDGELIAKTNQTEYTDRLAIGEHTYFVRTELADSDYYSDTIPATLLLRTDHPIICDVDGGAWVSLRLAAQSLRETRVSTTQDVTMLRVVGAQYPIAEKSDYRTKSYEISAAFVSEGDCNAFENLLGRVVCVKDQFKSIVVGVMSAQSKAITQFFTIYDAVVQQIDYVPEV